MKSIHCYAPAKINLTLDVKSKKDPRDDFHPIETIYHRIRLVDEMTLTESDHFEVVGDFECAQEDNLITKAFELINQYVEDAPKVSVKVEKNIPIGSGLGGGSSNFATFTKLYFKLFELGDIPSRLIKDAGHIGKDMPFFFQESNCALGMRYGEIIQPLTFNFSDTPLYLYVPQERQLTAEAYARLTQFDTSFTERFLKNPKLENGGNTFDQLLNRPKFKDEIHLTGSGSVFYSFQDLGAIEGCEKINTALL